VYLWDKAKESPTLVAQLTDPSVVLVSGEEGRQTNELITALNA
jgi:hypothetical protein